MNTKITRRDALRLGAGAASAAWLPGPITTIPTDADWSAFLDSNSTVEPGDMRLYQNKALTRRKLVWALSRAVAWTSVRAGRTPTVRRWVRAAPCAGL